MGAPRHRRLGVGPGPRLRRQGRLRLRRAPARRAARRAYPDRAPSRALRQAVPSQPATLVPAAPRGSMWARCGARPGAGELDELDLAAGPARAGARARSAATELDRDDRHRHAVNEQHGHVRGHRRDRVPDRVALGQLARASRPSAPRPRRRAIARYAPARSHDARLPDRAAQRHRRLRAPGCAGAGSCARAAAHSARCPPAEWPSTLTRVEVERRARSSARWSIAAGDVLEGRGPAAAVARAAGTRCSRPPSRARTRSPASARMTILPLAPAARSRRGSGPRPVRARRPRQVEIGALGACVP